MKTEPSHIETLRRAKRRLTEEFGDRKWFRGAGIAPGEAGLSLRLNVDKTALAAGEQVPSRILGQPIEVVYIKKYSPRSKGSS